MSWVLVGRVDAGWVGRVVDEVTLAEQEVYSGLDLLDKVVLDIGANTGMFMLSAVSKGANKVICVEPHPESFKVLQANSVGLRGITTIQGAVTEESSNSRLWLGGSSLWHSSQWRPGREAIDVAGVPLRDLLEQYKPDVIKLDVEGAEYGLLPTLSRIPVFVKQMAIELHILTAEYWHLAKYLGDSLCRQGFGVVRSPELDGPPAGASIDWNPDNYEIGQAGWVAVGVWKRS